MPFFRKSKKKDRTLYDLWRVNDGSRTHDLQGHNLAL